MGIKGAGAFHRAEGIFGPRSDLRTVLHASREAPTDARCPHLHDCWEPSDRAQPESATVNRHTRVQACVCSAPVPVPSGLWFLHVLGGSLLWELYRGRPDHRPGGDRYSSSSQRPGGKAAPPTLPLLCAEEAGNAWPPGPCLLWNL